MEFSVLKLTKNHWFIYVNVTFVTEWISCFCAFAHKMTSNKSIFLHSVLEIRFSIKNEHFHIRCLTSSWQKQLFLKQQKFIQRFNSRRKRNEIIFVLLFESTDIEFQWNLLIIFAWSFVMSPCDCLLSSQLLFHWYKEQKRKFEEIVNKKTTKWKWFYRCHWKSFVGRSIDVTESSYFCLIFTEWNVLYISFLVSLIKIKPNRLLSQWKEENQTKLRKNDRIGSVNN